MSDVDVIDAVMLMNDERSNHIIDSSNLSFGNAKVRSFSFKCPDILVVSN